MPTNPRHDQATWSGMVGCWRGSDELAVVDGERSWSGRELLSRAAGAAVRLTAETNRGAPVPALLSSSATALAYAIGGAASGRPLAPLGTRLTERELAPCIARIGSEILLAEPEFRALADALARPLGVRVITVREPPLGPDDALSEPSPADVAFVLHTSGTTGIPNAVPCAQGRLAARARVSSGLYELSGGARFATASPFHHVAGLGNHAVALAVGATVVPVPRFTVEAWSALAPMGITHALVVPTMLDLLLDAGVLRLPDLRVLLYGAAPVHPDTLRRTLEAMPDIQLLNLYGQTEGSPITCLDGDDHRQIVVGRAELLKSVGRAAPGVELWIDQPDEGGTGEVVLRASHVFAPDDDGLLRTGDLGRLDADGYLFLVGRRGDQIIRGGENVHPLEVEQVLEEHPAVREAAVIGVPDQRWGQIVTAYLVTNGSVDSEALRSHARARLAGFKVPSAWLFVDELPRSPTGKLLRRELPSNQYTD